MEELRREIGNENRERTMQAAYNGSVQMLVSDSSLEFTAYKIMSKLGIETKTTTHDAIRAPSAHPRPAGRGCLPPTISLGAVTGPVG